MKRLFTLFILLLAFSCNSIEENPLPEFEATKISETPTIKPPILVNGALKFENEESMSFWLEKVRLMEPSQFSKWESGLDFKSFSTLFDELVDVENEASDSLTIVFNQTGKLPARIHTDYPIHSKKTLPYLKYLYVFPGGGIAPLASILEHGMERLVNKESKLMVGNQIIQFKDNDKFINGRILKKDVTGINLLASPSPTGYTERHMSTVGKYRTITDLTFTIRESDPYLNHNFVPLPVMAADTWSEWHILVRNFRQGLFGWNTRKTTDLNIEGEFSDALVSCPNITSAIQYHDRTISANSGGSSTTALERIFISPNIVFNQCYNNSYPSRYKWGSIFDLEITGEGNNVSNFSNIYTYGAM